MRISDWSSDVCSSDLVEGFAGFGMDRDTAGPCLPTPHCKIDIERIQLDQPGATTDLLGSDQGSPRAGQGIEHTVAALGGVEQRIGPQAHGLWRRVRGQDIALITSLAGGEGWIGRASCRGRGWPDV